MTTAGKWLTFSGAGILALSIIIGLILGLSGIGSLSEVREKSIPVNGTTVQQFEAEQRWEIYHPQGSQPAGCQVSGPAPVTPKSNQTSTVTMHDRTYTASSGFVVEESGSYTVSCSNPETVLAPPVSVGGIISGISGVFFGVLGGMLGLGLLGLGIILWVIGRRKARA